MMMRTRSLLGVELHAVKKGEVLDWLSSAMNSREFHHVVTPNPEFLVEAYNNPSFRQVLNHADLRLPDGFGLRLLSMFTRGPVIPERITGVDTVEMIAGLCQRLRKRLVLMGGRKGVAARAAVELKKRYSTLNVVGLPDLGKMNDPWDQEARILSLLHEAQPDVLLVALGAPLQDVWIHEHRAQLQGVSLAMGVGGTLDFLSGSAVRAPIWMRTIGLEWLFRLIQQPKRWRRMIRATIVFPWLVLRNRPLREMDQ